MSVLFVSTIAPSSERYTLSLHDALPIFELLHGDPGVWDRGRLMRVGGGVNWPSKKKIEKGCVPILGRIVSINERSEEHTSELQSRFDLVCRLLLEKKKKNP